MAQLFRGIEHAALYSKFRPSPPVEFLKQILDFLEKRVVPPFKQALDVGCGSGQSTIILSPHFQKVAGIDVSEAQIKYAQDSRLAENIEYKVSTGDSMCFASSTVDLVTLSQALHWFDTSKLFTEVKRVLRQNGVIAVYGYWIPLPKLENEDKTRKLTELIENHLHNNQLEGYWGKGRYILQNRYADIHFPFEDCVRTSLIRKSQSSLLDYLGYLSSWSAYQKLYEESPEKAVALLDDVKKQFIGILEVDRPEAEINVPLSTEYFMIMGRN